MLSQHSCCSRYTPYARPQTGNCVRAVQRPVRNFHVVASSLAFSNLYNGGPPVSGCFVAARLQEGSARVKPGSVTSNANECYGRQAHINLCWHAARPLYFLLYQFLYFCTVRLKVTNYTLTKLLQLVKNFPSFFRK